MLGMCSSMVGFNIFCVGVWEVVCGLECEVEC